MRAADITTADLGVEVGIPSGEHVIVGTLTAVTYPAGMVRLVLHSDGMEVPITVPADKDIALPEDHLRFRAVTEPDTQLRGKFLHDLNHLRVMRRVEDILGGAL